MKQGDPCSAELYCLVLEPFLVHLRNQMESHGLNVLGHTHITSAYADDLCKICNKNESFEIVNQSLGLYESSSSAKVNFSKSVGCGVVPGRKKRFATWSQMNQQMNYILGSVFG